MHILFYTFSFPPKIDGVVSRVLNILKHLHEEGHSLYVTTTQNPVETPEWMEKANITVEKWKGIRMPIYPDQWLGHPFSVMLWYQVWRTLKSYQPDIVHLVGPDPLHYVVMSLCKYLDIPMVCSYHTDVISIAKHYKIPLLPSFVKFGHKVYTWSWFDRIITTSESFKSVLNDVHGIPCHGVWPKGVDTSLFRPQPKDPILRRKLTKGNPENLLFLYAGRFAAEKNLNFVVKVLRDFPTISLALIGSGPDKSWQKKNFPNPFYISEGFWTQLELAKAYACADIFITASCIETCGFSMLEALSCGLPVLAPNAQGVTDLVYAEKNGLLFEPNDLSDARSQVQRLIDEPELRDRLKKHSLKNRDSFSWKQSAKWLTDLYKEVLEQKRLKPRVE